jgi:hypothetical protein
LDWNFRLSPVHAPNSFPSPDVFVRKIIKTIRLCNLDGLYHILLYKQGS